MKSTYSEEYYRRNWERFMKKVPSEHYINLEANLNHAIEIYSELPAEAIEMIKRIEAKKLSDRCTDILTRDMEMIKKLKNKEVSLGYTTQTQEIHAEHDLVTRFEFNCLQLADFKKKYGITQ